MRSTFSQSPFPPYEIACTNAWHHKRGQEQTPVPESRDGMLTTGDFSGRRHSSQNWGGLSGCYQSILSHRSLLGRFGKGQTCCVRSLGLSRIPTRSPVKPSWVDSTWKCKAVGKRDSSRNRSLNWDFPAYKWKPGTAASGSQESRLRKAVALAQPLWSETNKLHNDTRGTVNVVLLLGNV